MTLKFQHVLAGEGMRRGEIQRDALVKHRAIAGAESAQGGLTGEGKRAAHGFSDGGAVRTRHANHADTAPARRGGDGGNGVGHQVRVRDKDQSFLPSHRPDAGFPLLD